MIQAICVYGEYIPRTTLGDKGVGATVNFKVNGVSRDFLVVQQGRPSAMYDASFDGGTVLLMKDLYENRQWHSANVNDYANSTIHSYLNSTFLNLIDALIRAKIKQVKIPYRPGTGGTTINSGASGLPAHVWLPGAYELNWTTSTDPNFPVDGTTFAYFAGTATVDAKRIAGLNGTSTYWWLRSSTTDTATFGWLVQTSGNHYVGYCSASNGIRPALVLPSTLFVTDTGEVVTG